MTKFLSYVVTGLCGVGIGALWFLVRFLMATTELHTTVTISLADVLLFVFISALIGVVFRLASLIFAKENWSRRKQIIVNFLVLFIPWTLYFFMVNNFVFSIKTLLSAIVQFIVMYAIGYGFYFVNLRRDINEINRKLKK